MSPAHPLARRLTVTALLTAAALGTTARTRLHPGPVRGVTGLGTTVTVLVAVLATAQLVVLLLALTRLRPRRRRGRDDEGEHAPAPLPIPGWLRAVALLAGLALLAAPWLALVLATGHGGSVTAPPAAPPAPTGSGPGTTPAPATPHAGPATSSGWPLALMAAAVAVTAVIALAWVVHARLAARASAPAAAAATTPASPGQPPTRSGAEPDNWAGDERQTVIAAWTALGRYLSHRGIPSEASDTPAALLARAEAAGALTTGPGRTLARLFREARFSSHPITAQQARQAEAALRQARSRTGGGP